MYPGICIVIFSPCFCVLLFVKNRYLAIIFTLIISAAFITINSQEWSTRLTKSANRANRQITPDELVYIDQNQAVSYIARDAGNQEIAVYYRDIYFAPGYQYRNSYDFLFNKLGVKLNEASDTAYVIFHPKNADHSNLEQYGELIDAKTFNTIQVLKYKK